MSATRCGTIPKDAGAYVLNLTVKPTTTLGFLTIWPNNGSASGMPVVSNLNDLDGRWLSNNTIVQNINGTLNVFATDETDLVVDVTGYFAPRRSVGYGMVLSTLFPCRIVNNAPSSYEFPGRVSSCGVPDQAEALALNVTIRPPPPPNNQFGYLDALAGGYDAADHVHFQRLGGQPRQ